MRFTVFWLVLSVIMLFAGINYTVQGKPDIAGFFYIIFLIHGSISIGVLVFKLKRKNRSKTLRM